MTHSNCSSSFPVYYSDLRKRLEISEPILDRIDAEVRSRGLSAESFLTGRVIAEFFVRFGEAMQAAAKRAEGKPLPWQDEAMLCRYFGVMARLDWFFRIGFRGNRPSPLISPKPAQTVEEMLAICPNPMLEDLRQLSEGFYRSQHALLAQKHVLNPKFISGRRVGGADADLIVDRCLIELKTTTVPKVGVPHLEQLIAYALLDSYDYYRLREVGIYFTRQQCLLKWSLDELLYEASGGRSKDLQALRQTVLQAYPNRIRSVPPEERLD